MLSIQNVYQTFRTGFWLKSATVLNDVTFTVPARSIFGFLGANGAGKTTLIQLMVGLRAPTQGSVKLHNWDCTSIEARSKIGYLPERPYFQDHLTGEQLLEYFGALSGMTRTAVSARIPKVLEEVGMSHARHRELKKYSKGMLQRIGIAQAILHEPEFLVLDEPMSGLDPVGRKEMRELILRLAKEGRTVFFSSHVIPDVEAICDQVAVIEKGKLVGSGPISQFLSKGKVQTEVIFSGLDTQRAEALNIFTELKQITLGLKGIVADEEAVNRSLQALISAGAKVHAVSPLRPSLEDVFYD